MNRMESLLTLLEEPAAFFGVDGKVALHNDSWSRHLPGVTPTLEGLEEALGEPPGALAGALQAVLAGTKDALEREMAGRPYRKVRLRARRVEEGGLWITLHELTGQHRLQQDLRESHTLFHHLLENTHDGVFLYNTEGCYILANSAYAESLGFTPTQLAGRNLFEVFKPDLAQVLQEQNLLVLSTGLTLHFEIILETPRGPRTVFVTKDPYRNHRNEVVGVFGIARDISDHRQVEETLEKSERHFRALIENSADRVALVARDGTIRYVSPSTKRVLGYDIDELVGTNAFHWVYPGDQAEVNRRFAELLEMPGGSITGQYRVLCKDGCWQWMEATATNLLDDPSVSSIVVNERDISERKRAEDELMRHAQIIVSSHDAIISASPEGQIQSWNPAAERIFGYNRQEMLGRSILDLVPLEEQPRALERQAAVLRGRSAHDVETLFLAKGGREVEVSLTLSPIRDQARHIVGFSKIVRDITERIQLEREILEISEREKQRLGQDLHDDLCQQLVGIALLANLLIEDMKKQGLEPPQEAYQIRKLSNEAVENARNIARGLCPLNLADSGFVASIQALVANTGQVYRIECLFECEEIITIPNLSVATHFYRIIQEALHNAAKHSRAGRVVVRLEREGQELVATIADNGVGLPEGALDRSASSGSLGLHTMTYRARFIKGVLEFQPGPGGGTHVVCRLPGRNCHEEPMGQKFV